MGVSITATNPKYSFDMGFAGFFSLRSNIACALDKDFGENYKKLMFCHTSEDYKENDRIAEGIINNKGLDYYSDILDFLYMSDCEGKIGYKTCKNIYDLIKDIDYGDKGFRYGSMRNNDYEEFKEFLLDCYSHRKNLRWW